MEGGGIKLERGKCNHCGRCVTSCSADAWKGAPGYILSFGGAFGNRIARGEEVSPIVTDKTALFRTSDAAVDFFAKHANPGERFRPAIERAGWDAFKSAIDAALHG
jgi:dissimilatory sulfite reductase (desulfoviridin) alpha/beta subunit